MARKMKIASNQRPFIMTYWDFIETKLFDWNEKRIVIILKKFADSNNQCFPSIKTLCELSQLSRNTVKKTLKSLKEKKIITIEYRKENGKDKSHLYTLHDYPELWNAESIEQIKKTVDIEELRLFELAKKKGYRLEKEKGLETTAPTKVTENSSSYNYNLSNKINTIPNSKESQEPERYTMNDIHQLFDYDIMLIDYPDKQRDIDSVMSILYTAMNTTKSTIRIAGEDKPTMVVIGKLMKLDKDSIMYTIEKFAKQTERINNPVSYMLTMLYNAPEQFNLDIQNLALHNMAHWNEEEKNI